MTLKEEQDGNAFLVAVLFRALLRNVTHNRDSLIDWLSQYGLGSPTMGIYRWNQDLCSCLAHRAERLSHPNLALLLDFSPHWTTRRRSWFQCHQIWQLPSQQQNRWICYKGAKVARRKSTSFSPCFPHVWASDGRCDPHPGSALLRSLSTNTLAGPGRLSRGVWVNYRGYVTEGKRLSLSQKQCAANNSLVRASWADPHPGGILIDLILLTTAAVQQLRGGGGTNLYGCV